MSLSLIAPAVAGIAAGVIGLGVLRWMNRNKPILQTPSAVEEQQPLPFEDAPPPLNKPEVHLIHALLGTPTR